MFEIANIMASQWNDSKKQSNPGLKLTKLNKKTIQKSMKPGTGSLKKNQQDR